MRKDVCKVIIEEISRRNVKTKRDVEKIKKEVCKKFGLSKIPRNVEILKFTKDSKISQLLIKNPIRSLSGVKIITVVAKPANCPGSCIYCYRGENSPQSYTGFEPAIQRAIRNNYDSFLQVRDRLWQYKITGHLSNGGMKCEIIVLGGTFLSLDKEYKEMFVKGIYDALNGRKSKNLEEAKRINEKSKFRCCNFTIETRPDFCKEAHVDEMLRYGVTRVEIGVQTIYPEILEKIRRGHTIEDVIQASKIARDSALKICHHYMPGLPGSDFEKDLEMFKEIFENENLRPDYLKIYPTLVVKGSELYRMWKRGEYEPYKTEELVELLAKVKKFIPKYCRIQRLGRDTPSNQVEAGCKKTNLRELVQKRAMELGIECKCIRCREVGLKLMKGIFPEKVELDRLEYDASGGKEIFLSFEDRKNDIIVGFLRLRIPSDSHRQEIDSSTALVRELRVMGPSVPIGRIPNSLEWQHKGLGRKLMEVAEEIARNEFCKRKMVVISGVGTREYYRKLGYGLEGPYMSKLL